MRTVLLFGTVMEYTSPQAIMRDGERLLLKLLMALTLYSGKPQHQGILFTGAQTQRGTGHLILEIITLDQLSITLPKLNSE